MPKWLLVDGPLHHLLAHVGNGSKPSPFRRHHLHIRLLAELGVCDYHGGLAPAGQELLALLDDLRDASSLYAIATRHASANCPPEPPPGDFRLLSRPPPP